MPRSVARPWNAALLTAALVATFLVTAPAAALVDPDGNPVVVDDGLRDDGSTDRLLEPAFTRAAAVAAAKAPKAKKRLRTLVVPMFWSGAGKDASNKKVRKRAKASMKQVDAYFRTVSRGRIGHRTTVLGWQKIPRPAARCGVRAQMNHLAKHGAQRARSAGKKPKNFDRIIFYVTSKACDGYSPPALAIGSMPGKYVWLEGTWSPTVLAHELGHNLGLGHSDYATCTAKNGKRLILGGSKRCRNFEYGDQSDLMGNNLDSGWLSAPKLARLGWFTKKNLVRNNSGKKKTYTLRPMSAQTKKRKAVRVKGTKGRFYWVEYRRATGLDAKLSPGLRGVQIRLAKPNARHGESQVLDMLPAPQNDWYDLHAVTLGARGSWTSPEGIKFTVRKVGKNAKVTIQRKTRKARKPLPPTPRVTPTDLGAEIAWTYPKDRGTPVQSYTVRIQSSAGQTHTQRVSQLDGRQLRTTLANLDPAHTYSLAVRATNHRGGSAWSSSVPVRPLDLRPTVTVHSPAADARLRGPVAVSLTPGLQAGSQAQLYGVDVCLVPRGSSDCYGKRHLAHEHGMAAGQRVTLEAETWHLTGPHTLRVTVIDTFDRRTTSETSITISR